jgi:hypothetical protein
MRSKLDPAYFNISLHKQKIMEKINSVRCPSIGRKYSSIKKSLLQKGDIISGFQLL